MKKQKQQKSQYFLTTLFAVHLLIFAVGRIVFSLYNSDIEHLSIPQLALTWLRGLPLDIRTTAMLVLVPALLSLQKRFSLRALLVPYYIVSAFVMAAIIGADTIMYEFWKFKLGAVVLSYAMSPEGTTNSVEPIFLITRVGSVLLAWFTTAALLIALTPKTAKGGWRGPVILLVLALLPVRISSAYSKHQSLFRNHVSTNSVFAFCSSFFAERTFQQEEDNAVRNTFKELYTDNTGSDITDTLLTTRRPNILMIQMESFAGKFVKELGGMSDVSPQLSQLIPQGIFFTQYYSNSFRTDRGTVSLQGGMVAHPTLCVMLDTLTHPYLPSLPRTLKEGGYHSAYMYPGPMTNMGKRQYLSNLDIDTLYDHTAFTAEELNCSWGAHDGTSAFRTLELIQERKGSKQPWVMTYQTISSHEPWIVPYSRLSDPKLNSFAYTDDVVGQLVNTLQNDPELWDNLLIIIIPDHGFLYEQTFEDPEFFHSPMLWLGGAVKQPKQIDVLMNQSDIYATLLAQMGLYTPDASNAWSRNVLSRNYTHPMVYCNFPAGIMLKDNTGTSILDITAWKPITEQPEHSDARLQQARELLHESYSFIENIHSQHTAE